MNNYCRALKNLVERYFISNIASPAIKLMETVREEENMPAFNFPNDEEISKILTFISNNAIPRSSASGSFILIIFVYAHIHIWLQEQSFYV